MPAQPNLSIASALECLLALGANGRPVGSRELARQLDMEPTKTNRLLGTLAGLGLADKTPNRKYIPGPGLHVLAAMALSGSHLLAASLEPIDRLREKTGLLVALGVLWRDQVCYLFHGAPGKPLHAAISSNTLFPAHHSSIGMILLSELPIETALRRVPTAPAAFRQELSRIKTQQYALVTRDTQSLAIGVSHPYVAGLALSGHFKPDALPSLLEKLHETASAIESKLIKESNG